ncbi:WYL domain-containing protein [Enterococcus larvae]|uniref:WYL domain-containing protein n=1 Tax=Enterococcus larvae TaxID=2794352 RepID=UPI003F322DA2
MNPLFHEIYGKYFRLISTLMHSDSHSEEAIRMILEKEGYGETAFSLLPSLVSEEENWHLFTKADGDYHRILQHASKQPITQIEKRWLKTMLEDQRIHNFLEPDRVSALQEALVDVESLFSSEMIDYFDQFQEGDPYEEPIYTENARCLLQAIQSMELVTIQYQTLDRQEGSQHIVFPEKLEYSQKNDKFRLRGKRKTRSESWEPVVFNLSEIKGVERIGIVEPMQKATKAKDKQIVCLLKDDRDTLERAMFHFSNYRKITQKTEQEREYQLTIYYPSQDETELLINILSFGPFLQVIEPDSFIRQIKYRLKRQKELYFPTELEAKKSAE